MWRLYDKTLESRLLLGTAGYPSPEILQESIRISNTEVATLSLRRQIPENGKGGSRFWDLIKECGVHILPNTAGCRTAKEAVATARMARELFKTSWCKLEVIGDEHFLFPDVFGLVEAAKVLCDEGFAVFPYTTADIVVGERLVEAGCKVLMPLASPIGSGQGLVDLESLRAYREHFKNETLIIDAGIGKPSDATRAMELGYDGVLLNTAVAKAFDPRAMAGAFAGAILSGRTGFEAGLIPRREVAIASTPTLGTPFWHESSP